MNPLQALQDAADMGYKTSMPEPTHLLEMRVPRRVMTQLEKKGLVRVSSVPGTMPQTRFSPGAYPILNEKATFHDLGRVNIKKGPC